MWILSALPAGITKIKSFLIYIIWSAINSAVQCTDDEEGRHKKTQITFIEVNYPTHKHDHRKRDCQCRWTWFFPIYIHWVSTRRNYRWIFALQWGKLKTQLKAVTINVFWTRCGTVPKVKLISLKPTSRLSPNVPSPIYANIMTS